MTNYNKMWLAVILFGGMLMGCQDEALQDNLPAENAGNEMLQSPETEIVPGVMKVVFRRTPVLEAKLQSLQTRSSGKTGLMSVDDALKGVKGVRLVREIPYTKKYEEEDREWGFDMWYRLEFDEGADVKEVEKALANVPEIAEAFPLTRTLLPQRQYEPVPMDKLTTRASATVPFNDPMLPDQWHYDNSGKVKVTAGSDIGLFKAWKVTKGDPRIVVAVLDGGIQWDHPDLADNMWINKGEIPGNGIDDDGNGYIDDVYGYNFMDSLRNNDGTIRPEGHGTHVAGTIAAVNNNGIGVCGIAGGTGNHDGVRLMSCQLSDGRYMYNENPAFIYAARNGALIAQCSWGGYAYSKQLETAIDYFVEKAGNFEGSLMKGGIVIAAAGNDNKEAKTYPSCLKNVVAVASTNSERKRSSFSQYGDWIDISAPGGELGNSLYQIASTWTGSSYQYEKGTSMACPHVSGIAALVIAANGGAGFTCDDLKEILFNSVTDLSTTDPYNAAKMGRGLLRADKALSGDDETAPEVVADLRIERGQNDTCWLVWSQVSDPNDGVAVLFRVYQSATAFTAGQVPRGESVEIQATGLEAGETLRYLLPVPQDHNSVLYYAVSSVDTWGNESVVNHDLSFHWSSVFIGADEMRLYPLPVVESLTVEWGENFTGNRTIRMYDLSGRKLLSVDPGQDAGAGKVELNLGGFAVGSYVLELKSDGKTERKNVLKVG